MEQKYRCIGIDTSFLIDLLRGDIKAQKKVKEINQRKIILATTVINAFEIFYGALISGKKEKNLQKAKELLELFVLFNMDYKSAYISAEIMSKLRNEGVLIDFRDIFIASILLRHNCKTIITRNVKHFSRIKNLQVETY